MTMNSASIRLETDTATLYSSGVYVYFDSREYIVSVCPHLLGTSVEHNFSAALLSSTTGTSVIWDAVELVGSAPLAEAASFAARFNGFRARPAEQARVSLFRFSSFSAQRVRQAQRHSRPLLAARPSRGTVAHILSSPFGGNHLFLGFDSRANVAAVTESNNVLLDARYMDDMCGGLVYYPGSGSIGLVQCELAKEGGEGKFIAVAPWSQILNALRLAKLADITVGSVESSTVNRDDSTIAVHVRLRAGRRAWGSGVVVGPDLVATNRHVIDNYLAVSVQLASGEMVPAVAVSEPIRGIDMVFLKLRNSVEVAAAQLASVPKVGTSIISRGFGLVYPGRTGKVEPLASSGVVAARHMCKTLEGDSSDSLAMFVSTSGCWNGSSGGGIYCDGQLVGMMASNARDEVTGEIMPDLAFAIPSNIIQAGLDRIATGKSPATAHRLMERLWSLKPVLVDSKRPSKL